MPPGYNPLDLCSRSTVWSVESKNILAGMRDSLDPMQQAQMGICGDNINLLPATGITSTTLKYFCITAIEDTTFNSALILDKGADQSIWSGKILKAGASIYGEFTKIKILTGFVRCYEHPFNA